MNILEATEMTETGIHTTVLNIVEEFIGVEVDGDEDLFDSGLVNSLFAMTLLLQVEQTFAIKVESGDLDLANFRSANAIAGFVQGKLADRALTVG